MQSFCFFVARRKGTSFGRPEGLLSVVPSRCLAYGTQSVGKRSGGATLRVRFAGGKVLQITKINKVKNFQNILKQLFYINFSPFALRASSKNQKVQVFSFISSK